MCGTSMRENRESPCPPAWLITGRAAQGTPRRNPGMNGDGQPIASYIPKADGRQRPLGIATLEDKIIQRAVVEVLNGIYEVDFRGFSCGFRPRRGPHQALDALATGIMTRRVYWTRTSATSSASLTGTG
jgi:hypothetical protein